MVLGWAFLIIIGIFYVILLIGGIVGILESEDFLVTVIATGATLAWLALGVGIVWEVVT